MRFLRRLLALTAALATMLVGSAVLADEAGSAPPQVLHVAPNGNDAAPGTTAQPLRTVTEAWRRIPRGVVLSQPVTIALAPGVYPDSSLPNYWEDRHGSAAAPIVLTVSGAPRSAEIQGNLNLFNIEHLRIEGLRIVTYGDVLHCERCGHVTVSQSVLDGRGGAHETYKANQSHDLQVVHSELRGAYENALDFVAVQRARITDSIISDAGDWCGYVKGGSVDIEIRGNEIRNCDTGGFVVGQGTGLEFMVAPWFTYEATDVVFAGNYVHHTSGAAFGVNGARNVVLEDNVATSVSTRSPLVEVSFGLRSCDGDVQACATRLAQGAWGTTALYGETEVFIPNSEVTIRNNTIVNPAGVQSRWQHFEVSAPRLNTGMAVGPSPARTDDGLRITGNVIRNGGADMPLGIDGTTVCRSGNPTCTVAQVNRDNDINSTVPVPIPAAVPGGVVPGPTGTSQPAPTTAPSGVAAFGGNGAVVVYWQSGADGATSHRVRVQPARGGAIAGCTATTERFCIVTGLTNLTGYRVQVVGHNAAGTGPPQAMVDVVVPRGRCVPVPAGPENPAIAAAIRARLASDPFFPAEFGAVLQQQMACNPGVAAAVRSAIAAAIAASPDGPVARAIAAAIRAEQQIAAEIANDPTGPTARRVAAQDSIR